MKCINCRSTNTYTEKMTLKDYLEYANEKGSTMRQGPLVPWALTPLMMAFAQWGHCRSCRWQWPTLR